MFNQERAIRYGCLALLGAAVTAACSSSSSSDGTQPAGRNAGGQGGEITPGAVPASTEGGAAGAATTPPGNGGAAPGGAASGGAPDQDGNGASGASFGGGGGAAGASGSGDGGEPPAFEPGQCDQGAEPVEPSVFPSCKPAAKDDACTLCLKQRACEQYQHCYGTEPRSACGWGLRLAEPGQYDCVRQCFAEGVAEAPNIDELFATCVSECGNGCTDGFVNADTEALVATSNDLCAKPCFPE